MTMPTPSYPWLTDEEILATVKPLTQPAAIVRWFRENGFPNCRPKPNGFPLIPRAQCDLIPGQPPAAGRDADSNGPNVKAYLDKIGQGAKKGATAQKV